MDEMNGKIAEILEPIRTWLNCDSTWNNDLDGYDKQEVADAVVDKFAEELEKKFGKEMNHDTDTI